MSNVMAALQNIGGALCQRRKVWLTPTTRVPNSITLAGSKLVRSWSPCINTLSITRIWANAQRDGRPAEYTCRPLFNAAKFG